MTATVTTTGAYEAPVAPSGEADPIFIGDAALYANLPAAFRRPLALCDILRAIRTLQQRVVDPDTRWCVIGGTAVLLHLINHPEAASRASLDVDISANRIDRGLPSGDAMIGGGRAYVVEGVPVRWSVRPERGVGRIWAHAWKRATRIRGVPVAGPRDIIALKTCMRRRAVRPKDRHDIALLLRHAPVTSESVAELVMRYAPEHLQETQRTLRDAMLDDLSGTWTSPSASRPVSAIELRNPVA